MTNSIRGAQLDVSVLCSADLVSAEVRDRRPDSITLFAELSEDQRAQLVHDAWSIASAR
jgi:uncharacterized tellurite resistance protein B-like protein